MNLFGNFGMIWGYFINLIISSEEWRFGLVIEICFIMSHVLFLSFIPNMYFDKDLFLDEIDKNNEDIFVYKKEFFDENINIIDEKTDNKNEKEDNNENINKSKNNDDKDQNENIEKKRNKKYRKSFFKTYYM